MKKDLFTFSKSSFLSLPKDTSLIIQKFLNNANLLKLLYYNIEDWQTQPSLSSEQKKELFDNEQISNIPKLAINEAKLNYIRLSFDNFIPNNTNTFYKDFILEIRIICHYSNWKLPNYELRPYRIAGEIDSMLNNQKFTGIGELNFLDLNLDLYDSEFAGVTLRYLAVHGNEDKVNPIDA